MIDPVKESAADLLAKMLRMIDPVKDKAAVKTAWNPVRSAICPMNESVAVMVRTLIRAMDPAKERAPVRSLLVNLTDVPTKDSEAALIAMACLTIAPLQ